MDTVDAFTRRANAIVTMDDDGLPTHVRRDDTPDPVRLTGLPPNFAITYMNALRSKHAYMAESKSTVPPPKPDLMSVLMTSPGAATAGAPVAASPQSIAGGVAGAPQGIVAGAPQGIVAGAPQGGDSVAPLPIVPASAPSSSDVPPPMLVVTTSNMFELMTVIGDYNYTEIPGRLPSLQLAADALLQSAPIVMQCGTTGGLTFDMTISFDSYASRPDSFLELIDTNSSRPWNKYSFYRLPDAVVLRIGDRDAVLMQTTSASIPWTRFLVRISGSDRSLESGMVEDGLLIDRKKTLVNTIQMFNMTALVRLRPPVVVSKLEVYDYRVPGVVA